MIASLERSSTVSSCVRAVRSALTVDASVRQLVANRDRRRQLLVVGGRLDKEFGVELGEGVAQVTQRWQPGALHRLSDAPQCAIDGLGRVAYGAQHDERNGVLAGQSRLHG